MTRPSEGMMGDYRLDLMHRWEKLSDAQRKALLALWETQENYGAADRDRKLFSSGTIDKLAELALVDHGYVGKHDDERRYEVLRLTREGLALVYFVKNDWWMGELNNGSKYRSPTRHYHDALRHLFDGWREVCESGAVRGFKDGFKGFEYWVYREYCEIASVEFDKEAMEYVEVDGSRCRFELPAEIMQAVLCMTELAQAKDKYFQRMR